MVLKENIVDDSLLVFLVTVLGWIIKSVFKPSKSQLTLITNVLLIVLSLLVKVLHRANASHPHLTNTIDELKSNLAILKNKVDSKKAVLG